MACVYIAGLFYLNDRKEKIMVQYYVLGILIGVVVINVIYVNTLFWEEMEG